MLRWLFRLLIGQDPPSRRALMATQDAIDALDARVDLHYKELKELRGRVNAFKRWSQSTQDDSGSTRDADPPPDIPQPWHAAQAAPSAHLSRRFRSHG